MQSNTQAGIVIMAITMLVFAIQDGISRHLATEYNVMMIVMIRYWFFAAFVIAIAGRKSGSIHKAAATKQPVLARKDSAATSFFWTGVSGAALATAIGVWFWEPMTSTNWLWMAALCISGATGHYLLIRAYEVAEANTLQPFAYLQLVFGSIIGITLLGETLEPHVLIGAIIIVGAGLFTITRRAAH